MVSLAEPLAAYVASEFLFARRITHLRWHLIASRCFLRLRWQRFLLSRESSCVYRVLPVVTPDVVHQIAGHTEDGATTRAPVLHVCGTGGRRGRRDGIRDGARGGGQRAIAGHRPQHRIHYRIRALIEAENQIQRFRLTRGLFAAAPRVSDCRLLRIGSRRQQTLRRGCRCGRRKRECGGRVCAFALFAAAPVFRGNCHWRRRLLPFGRGFAHKCGVTGHRVCEFHAFAASLASEWPFE